ncbi:MAG: glycosidase, partial [Chloroflexota bacterium]|nr:glycosidase [Chloroflexota bacterium]
SIGLIHRPLFPDWPAAQLASQALEQGAGDRPAEALELRKHRLRHESLWISYCNEPTVPGHLSELHAHHRLMSPRAYWERIKVGGGAPPILTRHGWLVIYHGVHGQLDPDSKQRLRYSAGALLLKARCPEEILYRSPHPVLAPESEEAEGIVPNVVFPTALDRRYDLGRPDRIDVYYGMADDRIGAATFDVPLTLPETKEHPESRRDAPEAA